MTTIMDIDEPRPRGTVIGRQISGPPLSEAEHFASYPLCRGYVDMRDLVWFEELVAASGLRSGAVVCGTKV
jgi:hypothetical protein